MNMAVNASDQRHTDVLTLKSSLRRAPPVYQQGVPRWLVPSLNCGCGPGPAPPHPTIDAVQHLQLQLPLHSS